MPGARRSRRRRVYPRGRRHRYPHWLSLEALAGLALLALGILALLVILSPLRQDPKTEHPAYFVLGDTSKDSTEYTRHRAQDVLTEAIDEAAAEHGFVDATPFQDHFISKSSWRRVSFIPPRKYDGDTRGTESYIHRELETYTDETKTLFLHPMPIDGTDIIGGLLSTANQFRSFPRSTSRVIVVASNMANVDYDEGIILKREHTTDEIEDILANLERRRQIAELTGTCVFVVGPGEITQRPLPNAVQVTIKDFWTEYFQLAGATVCSWGSTLEWPLVCSPEVTSADGSEESPPC